MAEVDVREIFEQIHATVRAAKAGDAEPHTAAAMQLDISDEVAADIFAALLEECEETVTPAVLVAGMRAIYGGMVGTFIAGALWERARV